jgi:ketosteroid isomerase-like protein
VPVGNLEIVRSFVEAFNRRDFGAVVGDMEPDVELREWPEAPGARSYRGPEGVSEALDTWFDVWDWMQVEIEDLVDLDGHVLVRLYQRARGKASTAEVELRSFNVYTFRDSKIARIELFTDERSALDAAGLDSWPSRGDEDLVRAINEMVGRGDLSAIAKHVHPDVVWEHNIGLGSPEEGVYRGKDALLDFIERILEPWEYMRPVARRVTDLGNGRYLARGELVSKHRTTDAEISTPYEHELEIRDGLLVHARMAIGAGVALAPREEGKTTKQET